MITVEDWAEIRPLYRSENLSQAAIARRLSLSRNTVAKAINAEAPPRYERAPSTTSAWAQIELAVRVLLGQFPTMPATVLAQRVGWRTAGTGRWLRRSPQPASSGDLCATDCSTGRQGVYKSPWTTSPTK